MGAVRSAAAAEPAASDVSTNAPGVGVACAPAARAAFVAVPPAAPDLPAGAVAFALAPDAAWAALWGGGALGAVRSAAATAPAASEVSTSAPGVGIGCAPVAWDGPVDAAAACVAPDAAVAAVGAVRSVTAAAPAASDVSTGAPGVGVTPALRVAAPDLPVGAVGFGFAAPARAAAAVAVADAGAAAVAREPPA
ncbi:MAG: hypothetical protein JO023_16170, partial [Chloroflexi bacterium]|nr:hypothetical protein [Chloroflexota bacterium]